MSSTIAGSSSPAPRPRSGWSRAACRARPTAAGGWRCRPRGRARPCRRLERHAGIERSRSRVVAHFTPTQATPAARLLDRGSRGEAHHEVAHAVVAVDQRDAGRFALDADLGLQVDAPPLMRRTYCGRRKTPWPSQPQTRRRSSAPRRRRVIIRHPDRAECVGGELPEPFGGDWGGHRGSNLARASARVKRVLHSGARAPEEEVMRASTAFPAAAPQ